MNNIFQYSEDGKTLLSIKDKKVKEVIIPDGITFIGDSAFEGCSSLQNIVIPNSVTFIGIRTFDDCILYIPIGTRWSYRHNPIFSKFQNIVTERFD